MFPDGGQQPVHLGGREGGGGAAADVEGADRPAGLPEQAAGVGDFPEQGLQVGRQILAEFFNALAHKGAVGAAGGTEGDAHVDREVPGPQQPGSLHGVAGGVDAQPPPGLGDEINVLQKPVGARLGAAGEQMGRGELGGPDPGQRPPGRRRVQNLESRQIEALLQNPAAAADVVPLRRGQPLDGPAHPAPVFDFGRGGQIGLARREGGKGLALVGLGKELHHQLLHGIEVLVTPEGELHRSASFI